MKHGYFKEAWILNKEPNKMKLARIYDMPVLVVLHWPPPYWWINYVLHVYIHTVSIHPVSRRRNEFPPLFICPAFLLSFTRWACSSITHALNCLWTTFTISEYFFRGF